MRRLFLVLSVLVVLSTVAVMFALPQPANAACLQTFVVRRGDNLFRIGLRFGLLFTRLQAMNGLLNPNLIRVGQRLCVRVSGASTRSRVLTRRRVTAPTGGNTSPMPATTPTGGNTSPMPVIAPTQRPY